MGGLENDWLSAELAQADEDIKGWSCELKDSFESMFQQDSRSQPTGSYISESDHAELASTGLTAKAGN